MAFSWGSIEEREQKKVQNEKNLKQFLLAQQDEAKNRKQQEKQRDINESKKMFGTSPQQEKNMDSYTNNSQKSTGESPRIKFQALAFSNSPSINLPVLGLHEMSASPTISSTRHFHDTSLTYLEDRLDQEIKLRENLEAELRAGKNVMAQLNAKIENLYAQAQLTQKAGGCVETGEIVRLEFKKDMERLSDGYTSRFNQVAADQVSLKTKLDKVNDVSSKKYKSVLEEVDGLKHLLETLLTKSAENNTDNEKAIVVVQKQCEAKFGQLESVLQSLKLECNQLNHNEHLLKNMFEQLVKDTATDLLKSVQQKIHSLESTMSSSLNANKELTEIRRLENEKLIIFVHDQTQNLVLRISEVKTFSEEIIKNKMKFVEDWISNEQSNAAKREYELKSEFEASVRTMETKTAHDIQAAKDDIKLKLNTNVKIVQHSINILEESTQMRLDNIEKIMKAEIEQRLEQQRKHEAEITKLTDQLLIAQSKFVELKTAQNADSEKIHQRVEVVQSNLKDVIAGLSDDVNCNQKSILHLQKSVQETSLSLKSMADSEKETIHQQVESQLQQVKTNIKQIQYSFGDLHTKSAQHEEKLSSIEATIIKQGDILAVIAGLKANLLKIENWKATVPEHTIARKTFEEFMSSNAQVLSDYKQQISEISKIISNSNVLKTVDVLHEFNTLSTKVQLDHAYIQEIVSRLSLAVEGKVSSEEFNLMKEHTEATLTEIQDIHSLTNADLDNIEKSLRTKVDQNQFQLVDVHVKNLKETLNTLASWIHDNATKQSIDIHKLLIDVQQGIVSRQQNQMKSIEETKERLEKKIDNVVLGLHDQHQKNQHFEEKTNAQIKLGDEKTGSKMVELKQNFINLVKSNADRVEEVERHIENLKMTMGTFVNEKIIPLATKNELQVFEANIQILASEMKGMRDQQRSTFEQMKTDIDIQSRKQLKSTSDSTSANETRQLKDSIRNTAEQSDQKYTQYVSTLHEMSDRLKSLELKLYSESISTKFNDGKIQDMSLQLRQLENQVKTSKPGFQDQQPIIDATSRRNSFRPASGNIFKPDLKLKSNGSLSNSQALKKSKSVLSIDGSKHSLDQAELSEKMERQASNQSVRSGIAQ